MATKIAINGFGRIGRLVLRRTLESDNFDIVAINDLTDAATLAHLLKYDSVHGILNASITADDQSITVNGDKMRVLKETDPAKLPWKELGAEIVVESTGRFTKREDAAKHLDAGAKRVVISAPGKDVDATFVFGVNEKDFDPARHFVISNASCTTNCLAPVAKVLDDSFTIVKGLVTTIHSYTNDQRILDLPHKDLRRARAAAMSMIPTSTGAAKAVSLVLPHLKGKLDGLAVRVPTPNVSLVDLVAEVAKETTLEEVNAAMKNAADGALKGILEYSALPLVSIDFNGNPASSIFDADNTKVIGGTLVKVLSWYDNEWGYSCRICDLIKRISGW
ncbi:MAG: type I glyceraldehyde-3-phosphate dehydrogenase [Deltaproteobacteria bacterium]|nr:type I glyceraldehyde-3-phosphate dehydrogenase [Deltaproteobacteria bacterium]